MIPRRFFVAVVALGLLFAALLVITGIFFLRTGGAAAVSRAQSPVRGKELLRAPGFDDFSALDDRAIGQIDAWLREQVDLAHYPSLSVAVVRKGKIGY